MAKVYVGLSGGVDSAVSAYLLRESGYDVVGAFIKGWEPEFLPCTGADDRLEAMRVAAHLGIPFETFDFEAEYKRDVADYFVNEYRAGRTPNPDVICNRRIKFGALWKAVHARGADYIATGHYAVVMKRGGNYELRASVDTEKDQTYFLWTLNQTDLPHVLFPVGGMKKSEVRVTAARIGLPNATRKDSQGLCFLGHVDMRSFLKHYIPPKPGSIIHAPTGRIVGEHDGAWYYTIGQHVGAETPNRLYVVGKDLDKNVLYADEVMSVSAARREITLNEMNIVGTAEVSGSFLARYRYRGALHPVTLEGNRVLFDEPQHIDDGQSLVLYAEGGGLCIGGGIVR